MRYMAWSYTDLLECPDDYVAVIDAVAREEAEARRRAELERQWSRR